MKGTHKSKVLMKNVCRYSTFAASHYMIVIFVFCERKYMERTSYENENYPNQGSHSTWKPWKNESTPGKPGNIMEV